MDKDTIIDTPLTIRVVMDTASWRDKMNMFLTELAFIA